MADATPKEPEQTVLLAAWDNSDTPLHNKIFVEQWLPQIMPEIAAQPATDLHASFLRELYPMIYQYGPNYPGFAATVPKFRAVIERELASNTQPTLVTLAELNAEFDAAYNADETYALLENNPEYVYRNISAFTDDAENIPGWADLPEINGLKEWAWERDGQDPEVILNAFILVGTYKDFYLTLPIFKTLPGFTDMADKFQQLLDAAGL